MDSPVVRNAAKGECPFCPFCAQAGSALEVEFLSPIEKLPKAKPLSVTSAVSPNRNVKTNIKMFLLNPFNIVLNLNRDLHVRKFAWLGPIEERHYTAIISFFFCYIFIFIFI